MPTIKEVAQAAGVSPATVSRVMSGKPTVAAELAVRVRQKAAELDYRPSSIARSLRTKHRMVWGVIVSDIRNPFFTDLVRGVEDVAQRLGISLILGNADERADKEAAYIDLFVAERMAGVIISPASPALSDVGPLLEHRVPVVAVDRQLRRQSVDTVLSDNVGGAARATQHLLDQGYRRIACVTGPSDRTTATDRLAGYTKAIREWGIALDEGLVRHADFKEAGGYEKAYALLTTTEPPDAFFVTNNQMTLGALAAIAALELNVPEDVGVVGFDDPAWAPLLRPPLTAIAQPAYEMGATAARLLEDRAAGDNQPPRLVVMPTDLVVRGTSLRRAPEAQEASPTTIAF